MVDERVVLQALRLARDELPATDPRAWVLAAAFWAEARLATTAHEVVARLRRGEPVAAAELFLAYPWGVVDRMHRRGLIYSPDKGQSWRATVDVKEPQRRRAR